MSLSFLLNRENSSSMHFAKSVAKVSNNVNRAPGTVLYIYSLLITTTLSITTIYFEILRKLILFYYTIIYITFKMFINSAKREDKTYSSKIFH